MNTVRKTVLAAASLVIVGSYSSADATEGYFQHGYSAIQKAQAGAGIANPEDAMTIATNPAGLVSTGDQFETGVSLFSPHRQYSVAPGSGFVAPGTIKSGWTDFVMPNIGYSQEIDANSSWGIAMYGNGGMNTNYSGSVANPACGGGTGVYCGGKAGVNLSQMFLSAAYAWKSGKFALGIAPVFSLQMFDAHGLAAFSAISSSPTNLTNRGISYSYGAGVRGGMIWTVSPTVRLGISAATPTWMSKFSKYKGLFADSGAFDVPGNVAVGLAWDSSPDWTLMLDYKHIFYSDVNSVGNASAFTGTPFGEKAGPGFGWKDVDVLTLGAEWHVSPEWTLRAGYAHNNNPIPSSDVTINILAPGVVTDHFSAGVSDKFNDHSSIDLAATYVPKQSVDGPEVVPGLGATGRTISLSMYQYDVTVEWRYQF